MLCFNAMHFHTFHMLNNAKKSNQTLFPAITILNIKTRIQPRLIFSKSKEVWFVLSKCELNETKEKEIEKFKKKTTKNCNMNN